MGSPIDSGGRSFGELLRWHRRRARLTQEGLAELCGLSVRTLRDMEAGRVRSPRVASLRLLETALELSGVSRDEFEKLALGHPPGDAPSTGLNCPLVTPWQLPHDVGGFAGRTQQIAQLDRGICDDSLSAPGAISITGTAGVGKTALAVHWAHRVADRFPDGQLFVNLRGHAPVEPVRPVDALTQILRGLGMSAERIPLELDEASALYRTLLAPRRMLVVLDNAASAEQVRPLLPGRSASLTLITGRRDLEGLTAREGVRPLLLDVLTPSESAALLGRLLDTDRLSAEPEQARRLAELCAHLPLALRIMAAKLVSAPQRKIGQLVTELESGNPIGVLRLEGDPESAIEITLGLSYRALPLVVRRAFRLLGLVPGPHFDGEALAALMSTSRAEADRLLADLARGHLVQQIAPGLYTFHDLLRLYAREQAAVEEPHATEPLERLLYHYVSAVEAAARCLYPYLFRVEAPESLAPRHADFTAEVEAIGWLDTERPNLLAAIRHGASSGPSRVAWTLAAALRGYLWFRGYTLDAVSTAEAAIEAVSAEVDETAHVAAEVTAAKAFFIAGDHARAAIHCERAAEVSRRVGLVTARASALAIQGPLLVRMGRPDEAVDRLHEALMIALQDGQREYQGAIMADIALAHRVRGRLREAAELARDALTVDRDCGSEVDEGIALARLAEAFHLLGRLGDAAELLSAALEVDTKIGNHAARTPAQAALAAVLADMGDHASAGRLARSAASAAEQRDRWTRVECSSMLGTVLRLADLHRDAITAYQQALATLPEEDHSAHAAVAQIGLGLSYCRLGHLDEAECAARAAFTLCARAGYRVLEGQALDALARIRLAQYDRAAAVEAATAAIAIHSDTGHRLGEARGLITLGRARLPDTMVAIRHWQAASSIVVECGAKDLASSIAILLEQAEASGPETAP
jgi:tetratricopeptide (TPR) repeat protein